MSDGTFGSLRILTHVSMNTPRVRSCLKMLHGPIDLSVSGNVSLSSGFLGYPCLKPSSDFVYSKSALSEDELIDYERLDAFVRGFPPTIFVDNEGNLITDNKGQPLTRRKFIDTKNLLACSTRVEAEELLRTMLSIQQRLCKIAQAKLARKSMPRPSSAATSTTAFPSPFVEVIGDKRPNEAEDTGRGPPKVARTEGGSDVGVQHKGLHVLQAGVVAGRLVLPPAFGHGRMLEKNTKVVLSEAEKIILSDMGPEGMRAEFVDATVTAFKLMEIANFLNGRECKYLKERDDARKQVRKLGQDLNELQASYEAYQEKYPLHISLTPTLAQKEEEVEKLTKANEALVLVAKMQRAKIAELEDQLKTSAGPSVVDKEESSVDPLGEFAGFSRATLIAKIMEGESAILDLAKSSFDNAVAQIKCLNPAVKLVTEGLSELKEVHDGVLVSPPPEEKRKKMIPLAAAII